MGFKAVESWPSVFVLHTPDEAINIAFVVYVDDLVMVGCQHLVNVIRELRKSINMDEPAELKKYLGCVLEIAYKTCGGERVMKVTFNMTNYVPPVRPGAVR